MSDMRHSLGENKKSMVAIIIGGIIAIVGAVLGLNVAFNVNNGEAKLEVRTEIEYAGEEVPTLIETDTGEIEVIDAPTVDFVDSGKVEECPEESEECARGAVLPYLNITSPTTVYDSVINQCIDFDGAYGSQCYDLFAYFHWVYTGRWLSTNGTGAAYGIWDARAYNNPINPETGLTYYEEISDTHSLRPGDIAVFHNGFWGHVGIVLGYYNNGYIALLGTNQGGPACAGGGSVATVINMSLASFSGAFRPRIWIEPEPTPEPTLVTGNYIYKQGDYFSKMLVEQGFSDGTNLWGANGDVAFYNEQLYRQGILDYYNGKYWNNIPIGTEVKLEKR